MNLKQFIRDHWDNIVEVPYSLRYLIDGHPRIYTKIKQTLGSTKPTRQMIFDFAFGKGRCKICSAYTRWYQTGYATYCAGTCRDNAPEVIASKKRAWAKFEGGHPAADPGIRSKIKRVWKKRYGVDNPVHLDSTQKALSKYTSDRQRVRQANDQRTKTLIERYGDLPFRTVATMQKRRNTLIAKAKAGISNSLERIYPVWLGGKEYWLEGSTPTVALRLAASGVSKFTNEFRHYPDIRYNVTSRYWPDLMFCLGDRKYIVEVKSPYTLGVYKHKPNAELFKTNLLKFKAAKQHNFLLAVVVRNQVVWFTEPHKLNYQKALAIFSERVIDNTHTLIKTLCL